MPSKKDTLGKVSRKSGSKRGSGSGSGSKKGSGSGSKKGSGSGSKKVKGSSENRSSSTKKRRLRVQLKEKVDQIKKIVENSIQTERDGESPNLASHYVVSRMFNKQAPLLILTAGPTGSGKSKLFSMVYEMIYKTAPTAQEKRFESFLIDDYVEASDIYKRKVDGILFEFSCPNKDTCDFRNPTSDFLKSFETAYMSVRGKEPCTSEDAIPCKDKMMMEIKQAKENNKNVLIETTGKKVPIEYVKLFPNYNVVFVYSLVSVKKLVDRNKGRATAMYKKYVSDKDKHPAPRVVDVSLEKFTETVDNIKENLFLLRNVCMDLNKNTNECGDISKSRRFNLIVFDNNNEKNTRTMKIVYDHNKFDRFLSQKDFNKLIEKSFK